MFIYLYTILEMEEFRSLSAITKFSLRFLYTFRKIQRRETVIKCHTKIVHLNYYKVFDMQDA
jgi:hypothetical protein